MPSPSELQRVEEESREAWRNREETEHAPRTARSVSDLYEEALDRSNDLRLPKQDREVALRVARQFAELLGIDGPPPVNGRPAEPQLASDAEIIQRVLRIISFADRADVDGSSTAAAKLWDIEKLIENHKRFGVISAK